MIEQTLEQLGFNQKETLVFIEVYKRGKTTPGIIARTTGINRGTVYSIIKTLIKKGVFVEDLAGKPLSVSTIPVKELSVLAEREQKVLQQKRSLVNQAIEELGMLRSNVQYSIPIIRFVEEENIDTFLSGQGTKWAQSAVKTDNIWWGFQDHTFVENYKDWMTEWEKKRESDGYKNLQLHLLSNSSEVEKGIGKEEFVKRHIRFWKEDFNFTATQWIAGDYLIMIYTREKPFYAIEIFNPVLAENFREVFKNIWSGLETE